MKHITLHSNRGVTSKNSIESTLKTKLKKNKQNNNEATFSKNIKVIPLAKKRVGYTDFLKGLPTKNKIPISSTVKTRSTSPTIKQWTNGVYNFNNNFIKNLPYANKMAYKIINTFFSAKHIPYNPYGRPTRLSVKRFFKFTLNTILVSKPEIKHFNNNVNITLFMYNKKKTSLLKNLYEKFFSYKAYTLNKYSTNKLNGIALKGYTSKNSSKGNISMDRNKYPISKQLRGIASKNLLGFHLYKYTASNLINNKSDSREKYRLNKIFKLHKKYKASRARNTWYLTRYWLKHTNLLYLNWVLSFKGYTLKNNISPGGIGRIVSFPLTLKTLIGKESNIYNGVNSRSTIPKNIVKSTNSRGIAYKMLDFKGIISKSVSKNIVSRMSEDKHLSNLNRYSLKNNIDKYSDIAFKYNLITLKPLLIKNNNIKSFSLLSKNNIKVTPYNKIKAVSFNENYLNYYVIPSYSSIINKYYSRYHIINKLKKIFYAHEGMPLNLEVRRSRFYQTLPYEAVSLNTGLIGNKSNNDDIVLKLKLGFKSKSDFQTLNPDYRGNTLKTSFFKRYSRILTLKVIPLKILNSYKNYTLIPLNYNGITFRGYTHKIRAVTHKNMKNAFTGLNYKLSFLGVTPLKKVLFAQKKIYLIQSIIKKLEDTNNIITSSLEKNTSNINNTNPIIISLKGMPLNSEITSYIEKMSLKKKSFNRLQPIILKFKSIKSLNLKINRLKSNLKKLDLWLYYVKLRPKYVNIKQKKNRISTPIKDVNIMTPKPLNSLEAKLTTNDNLAFTSTKNRNRTLNNVGVTSYKVSNNNNMTLYLSREKFNPFKQYKNLYYNNMYTRMLNRIDLFIEKYFLNGLHFRNSTLNHNMFFGLHLKKSDTSVTDPFFRGVTFKNQDTSINIDLNRGIIHKKYGKDFGNPILSRIASINEYINLPFLGYNIEKNKLSVALKYLNSSASSLNVNSDVTLKNFIYLYKFNYLKNIFVKENLYLNYITQLNYNNSLYKSWYLTPLKNIISRIYNKQIKFNFVNLKHTYLSSDLLTQTIKLRLENLKKNKLNRILKSVLNLVILSKINRYSINTGAGPLNPTYKYIADHYNRYKTLNSIIGFTSNSNSLLSNTSLELNKKNSESYILDTNGSPYKKIKWLDIVQSNTINLVKYKTVSGVKVITSGRLSRRSTAARSVYKYIVAGSLKNDSNATRDLNPRIKSKLISNIQYTKLQSNTRNGSFGVKTWIANN